MSAALLVEIELPDGGSVLAYGADALREVFVEESWYTLERASFFHLEEGKPRRPLVLADVTSDTDDQFRYYRGTLRDAETGEPVCPPIDWDVRWLR